LIYYRRGKSELGKEFYRQALAKAEGKAFESMRAMAAIYFAREEILAGSPNSSTILELAHREAESRPFFSRQIRSLGGNEAE